MGFNFPAGPTDGDSYELNGVTFTYDATDQVLASRDRQDRLCVEGWRHDGRRPQPHRSEPDAAAYGDAQEIRR